VLRQRHLPNVPGARALVRCTGLPSWASGATFSELVEVGVGFRYRVSSAVSAVGDGDRQGARTARGSQRPPGFGYAARVQQASPRLAAIAVVVFALLGVAPAQLNIFSSAQSGSVADIQAAIANGAAVEARTENGWTPLMLAARYNGNPDVTAWLLAAGADVAARDPDGWTPLTLAARDNANPAIVTALVNAGANPNSAQSGFRHLLALALQNQSLDVARELTRLGARPQRIPDLAHAVREGPHRGTVELLDLILEWLSLERNGEPGLQMVVTPTVVSAGSRPTWNPPPLPNQLSLYRTLARSQVGIDITLQERFSSEQLAAEVIGSSESEQLYLPLSQGRTALIAFTTTTVRASGDAELVAEFAGNQNFESVTVLMFEQDALGAPKRILWIESLADASPDSLLGELDLSGVSPLQRRILAGVEPLGVGARLDARTQLEIAGLSLDVNVSTSLESIDKLEARWLQVIDLSLVGRDFVTLSGGAPGSIHVKNTVITRESLADPFATQLTETGTVTMRVELGSDLLSMQLSTQAEAENSDASWETLPLAEQFDWLKRAIDSLTELLIRG